MKFIRNIFKLLQLVNRLDVDVFEGGFLIGWDTTAGPAHVIVNDRDVYVYNPGLFWQNSTLVAVKGGPTGDVMTPMDPDAYDIEINPDPNDPTYHKKDTPPASGPLSTTIDCSTKKGNGYRRVSRVSSKLRTPSTLRLIDL